MEIKKGKMENGGWRVKEIKFWGEGCAISQASASMLTERIKGKITEEIKKITKDDILSMLGVQLSPTRLKCALLPLEVLQKVMALVESKYVRGNNI